MRLKKHALKTIQKSILKPNPTISQILFGTKFVLVFKLCTRNHCDIDVVAKCSAITGMVAFTSPMSNLDHKTKIQNKPKFSKIFQIFREILKFLKIQNFFKKSREILKFSKNSNLTVIFYSF